MNPSNSKFRIGLIGCGRISQTYIQALSECDEIDLTKVMDIRKEAAVALAEVTGAKATSDIDEFVKNNDLDGVIISTPPNQHAKISEHLMKHGISVLCEKPLTFNLEAGIEMYKTAEKYGVVLMMASKFRYVDDLIRAKAMIEADMLGEVHYYHNQFCSSLSMNGRWNSKSDVSGGGVIIDNGPHAFDIVNYLIGPIEKVYVHERSKVSGMDVEDTVTISFITKNNMMGTIYLSWSIELKNQNYISISGTEGSVQINWDQSSYHPVGHRESIPFGEGYHKVTAFKKQIRNFVNTIRGHEKPLISPQDGLFSIKLITAAYRSLQLSQWVNIDNE